MTDDNITKGGLNDPVAQSIRAEQARDAAPTSEEAHEERRKHLASEGCKWCGEDDPDELQMRTREYPECNAFQHPPDFHLVACDPCYEENTGTLRERAFQEARDHNETFDDTKVVGVIFYWCGAWELVEVEPISDCGPGGKFWEDEHPNFQPHGPLECRCGSAIDEYVPLGEEDDD